MNLELPIGSRAARWARIWHWVTMGVIAIVLVIYLVPLVWILLTSVKEAGDIHARKPVFLFRPTLRNYQDLGVQKAQLPDGRMMSLGSSGFFEKMGNSAVVAGLSTCLAIALGLLAAYVFSRFPVKGKSDWLFFILSTRMLPAMVVAIPIYLMYVHLGMFDTHLGLVLLYTVFNLSFAVWLLKGFLDEIPRDYEDAALVDGYTRFQAFRKVVVPQALTGIIATAVFCLITAWNEYAFALVVARERAMTAPPFIPTRQINNVTDWGGIAAQAIVFVLPVAVFTFLMRNHLLRGVTFGAIKR